MAHQLRYVTDTYTPSDDIIPLNSTSVDPVQFDLAPAEGPDLARLKSIIVAVGATFSDVGAWTPEAQQAVVSAFHHGALAFINTVTAVRGLTVPAAMAVRIGLIRELPTHVPPGSAAPVPNPEAPVPVRTGLDYSRACGFLSTLSMHLATEILKLTDKTGIDARFFPQPSGSGGQETAGTIAGAAAAVPPAPGAAATAASQTREEPPPRGTSRRRRS